VFENEDVRVHRTKNTAMSVAVEQLDIDHHTQRPTQLSDGVIDPWCEIDDLGSLVAV
jgi:hypothetical protein